MEFIFIYLDIFKTRLRIYLIDCTSTSQCIVWKILSIHLNVILLLHVT